MNFLNKKYTSLHNSSPYQSNSRSFLPSSSTLRQSPLSSNNCESHPSEAVRHMCLECVELLCSECISDHLQLHREGNIIPKIVSIRQLRGDMEMKIENISQVINSQNIHLCDLDSLKRQVIEKIEIMKKELLRAVDDFIKVLKEHMISSLGFEEVAKSKTQIQKLREEVNYLQQGISSNQASIVKRIYSIDEDRLKNSCKNMFQKFDQLQEKTEFEIILNWKDIIKGIEDNITVKHKVDNKEEESKSPQSRRDGLQEREEREEREQEDDQQQ